MKAHIRLACAAAMALAAASPATAWKLVNPGDQATAVALPASAMPALAAASKMD